MNGTEFVPRELDLEKFIGCRFLTGVESAPAHWTVNWSVRKKEQPFFSWPLPLSPSSIARRSGYATADVHQPPSTMSLRPFISCSRISPASTLSWIQISLLLTGLICLCRSTATRPPPPSTTSVYPMLSGSHSFHTHSLSGRNSK